MLNIDESATLVMGAFGGQESDAIVDVMPMNFAQVVRYFPPVCMVCSWWRLADNGLFFLHTPVSQRSRILSQDEGEDAEGGRECKSGGVLRDMHHKLDLTQQ